jgi:DNA-directed RNA polymerase subunit alpha
MSATELASPQTPEESTASFDPSILGNGDLRLRDLFRAEALVFSSPVSVRALRRALADLKGEQLGLAHWLLNEHAAAEEALGKARNRSEAAEYCWAECLLAKGEISRAQQTFAKLQNTYADELRHAAGVVRCAAAEHDPRVEGSTKALHQALKSAGKAFDESAEGAYFRGWLAEMEGDPQGAFDHYELALQRHPQHRDALQRKAFLLDLHGHDDEAIHTYERLVDLPPVSAQTLSSLGLLYEDQGKLERAMACFEAILSSDPANPHARLHLADIRATRAQFYDEDLERKEDKLQQILRIPITDFELSVRARNCLARMEIQTLGDLVKKSEVELLSYKNFGETSLNEIKDILRANGLRLGMERDDGTIDASKLRTEVAPTNVDALNMPINDLQLSVRSRRTVDRLGCKTVGDLARRSEAELLAQPNFGHTSLNEIKHKLENLGLSLAKR